MKTYIFYTMEGYTESPTNERVENIQLLGRGVGKNKADALEAFLIQNPWITESGFKREEIIAEQVLNEELKSNIKKVIEYLWEDEKKHYEEDKVKNHIYLVLKEIKNVIV